MAGAKPPTGASRSGLSTTTGGTPQAVLAISLTPRMCQGPSVPIMTLSVETRLPVSGEGTAQKDGVCSESSSPGPHALSLCAPKLALHCHRGHFQLTLSVSNRTPRQQNPRQARQDAQSS